MSIRRASVVRPSVNFLTTYPPEPLVQIPYNFTFVFVALRPMSTAMVIAGRSVHLTTLFPGQA